MPTVVKSKRKRPSNSSQGPPKRLTEKQQTWLNELPRCEFNKSEAARRAGYSNPGVMGARLGSDEFPLVKAELTRMMQAREARAVMDGNALLDRIHFIINF